uniref:Uncharacterized protein n=1 Tax=Ananas comosus var. bracteatus TaxID=296719 RepID=A0A6V7QB12_ANACO|nr:unnamed protein product [Ananas comosus var. bracteatus]
MPLLHFDSSSAPRSAFALGLCRKHLNNPETCWLKWASILPCGGSHVGPSHIRNGVTLGGPSHVQSGVRLGGPSYVQSGVRLVGPSHNRDPWALYLYALSELVAYF